MSQVTISALQRMKAQGEKIAMLTCYDAGFARVIEAGGVDVLLVGDTLGMVVQGQESTLPVTVGDMVYHTAQVARARRRAFLVADMPFLSYSGPEVALRTAGRLMKDGKAHMVKLEGGASQLETVQRLTGQGVPVCAHLGLQPQSVHRLGGYRVQGRELRAAEAMVSDARALEAAGAQLLVLECVPSALGAAITRSLSIPVIGIGAGPECDGQVLVLYDILGISPEPLPRFASNFHRGRDSIQGTIEAYVAAVREGRFPGPEHGFQ